MARAPFTYQCWGLLRELAECTTSGWDKCIARHHQACLTVCVKCRCYRLTLDACESESHLRCGLKVPHLRCDSHASIRCATLIPNLGTLGLCILELFAMYVTDWQTDRRTDKSNAYCPLHCRREHNKAQLNPKTQKHLIIGLLKHYSLCIIYRKTDI